MKKPNSTTIRYTTYSSPIGTLYIAVDEIGVRKVALSIEEWEICKQKLGNVTLDPIACQDAVMQLEEYFTKGRKEFTVPLSIEGTEFQKTVWTALLEIPYGEVRSYKDIAIAVGKPKGPRAIGQANRTNPLPIFIPCHRVIGHSGSMVGYAGKQVGIKESLLKLEGSLR